ARLVVRGRHHGGSLADAAAGAPRRLRARERHAAHGGRLRAGGVRVRGAGVRALHLRGPRVGTGARAHSEHRRPLEGARAARLGAAAELRGAGRADGPGRSAGPARPGLHAHLTRAAGSTLARAMPTVGVIGLGYVGLPLAVAFAGEGCDVVALDADSRKVAAVRAGESYIVDITDEELRAVADRIQATTRYAELARCDAVLMCLPTPLTPNREPDLGPLTDSTRALGEVLQAGQLVVLESTTYPGTTRERIAPLLEES